MKKLVIGIIALVCVAGVVCFGTFMTVKDMYEVKFAKLNRDYEREIREIKYEAECEIAESNDVIAELYDAIYDMHTYNDYCVTIRHNNEVHTIGCEWIVKGVYSRTWDVNWSD